MEQQLISLEDMMDDEQLSLPPSHTGNLDDPFTDVSFGGASSRQQETTVAPPVSDPFKGFEGFLPDAEQQQQLPELPILGQQKQQQQHQQQDKQQQQQHDSSPKDQAAAARPALAAASDRAARIAHMLQQHSADQGESNARLRLMLATVAAKQVKARKMLAELSAEVNSNLAAASHSSDDKVKQLTARLHEAQQQLAEAKAELQQQHKAAKQHVKLAQLQESELSELRSEVHQLRDSEAAYQAEIQGLQEQLLEAEAALGRLTAGLPGGWKKAASATDLSAEAGSSSTATAAQAATDMAATAAEAAAAAGDVAAAELLLLTPTSQHKRHGSIGSMGGAGIGASSNSSMMTPDQAAAARLKSWLHESQAALMEAQEELMAKEALIKQLQQQLSKQSQSQQQQQQEPQQEGSGSGLVQEPEGQPPQQQEQQQQGSHPQQQELQELQAAAEAAAAAAAAAGSERDKLASELSSIKGELSSMRLQFEAADSARVDAVTALEALKQEVQEAAAQQLQQAAQAAAAAAEATETAAAAERAAAAESELQAALAAAADAAREVSQLQEQLKRLQEQAAAAQQPSSPNAATAAAATAGQEMAGPATPGQHNLSDDPDSSGAAHGNGKSQGRTNNAMSAAAAGASEVQHQQQQGAAVGGGDSIDAADGQPASMESCELLQATSRVEALQEELTDTQQRLLLLLRLIKNAAATAAGGLCSPGDSPAALSSKEQQQLQQLLDGVATNMQDCKTSDSPGKAAAAMGAGSEPSACDDAAGGTAAGKGDQALDMGVLQELVQSLQWRYGRPQQLQQAMLRGKEMQLVLQRALHQVHVLKAEAGCKKCDCPSDAEWVQLADRGVPAEAEAGGEWHAAAAPTAAAGDAHTQGFEQHAAGYSNGSWQDGPAAATAAAAAPTAGDSFQHLLGEYSTSTGGHSGSYGAFSTGGGAAPSGTASSWDDWQGTSGGGAGQAAPGSCSTDALRAYSSSAAGMEAAGAAAAGSCDGATAAAGSAGGGLAINTSLAPLVDEGLGYDGLEGAWWARSTIEAPVTDLPDFLIKKA